MDEGLDTPQLHRLVDQIRNGDRSAQDRLVVAIEKRVLLLARRMLKGFPRVARWEDADDVYQESLVKLLRAIQTMDCKSMRDFFNLAAIEIRRHLLDLARHYQGPLGLAARYESGLPKPKDDSSGLQHMAPQHEALDPAPDGDELARWTALHQAIDDLPVAERETFSLTFYHGWNQRDIAELFNVDERTVRRRWQAACLKLGEAMGGELPTL